MHESLNFFVRKKTAKVTYTTSKKGGRKAKWSQSLMSDLVHIIISGDYYKKKLIFTNGQQTERLMSKFLPHLKSEVQRGMRRSLLLAFNS